MKLFGGVVVARSTVAGGAATVAVPLSMAATSLPLARVKAMLRAWEVFSPREGWHSHDVQLVEASPEQVRRAARALAGGRTGGHSR